MGDIKQTREALGLKDSPVTCGACPNPVRAVGTDRCQECYEKRQQTKALAKAERFHAEAIAKPHKCGACAKIIAGSVFCSEACKDAFEEHLDNLPLLEDACLHERTRMDDGISSCLDCGDRIDTDLDD